MCTLKTKTNAENRILILALLDGVMQFTVPSGPAFLRYRMKVLCSLFLRFLKHLKFVTFCTCLCTFCVFLPFHAIRTQIEEHNVFEILSSECDLDCLKYEMLECTSVTKKWLSSRNSSLPYTYAFMCPLSHICSQELLTTQDFTAERAADLILLQKSRLSFILPWAINKIPVTLWSYTLYCSPWYITGKRKLYFPRHCKT